MFQDFVIVTGIGLRWTIYRFNGWLTSGNKVSFMILYIVHDVSSDTESVSSLSIGKVSQTVKDRELRDTLQLEEIRRKPTSSGSLAYGPRAFVVEYFRAQNTLHRFRDVVSQSPCCPCACR